MAHPPQNIPGPRPPLGERLGRFWDAADLVLATCVEVYDGYRANGLPMPADQSEGANILMWGLRNEGKMLAEALADFDEDPAPLLRFIEAIQTRRGCPDLFCVPGRRDTAQAMLVEIKVDLDAARMRLERKVKSPELRRQRLFSLLAKIKTALCEFIEASKAKGAFDGNQPDGDDVDEAVKLLEQFALAKEAAWIRRYQMRFVKGLSEAVIRGGAADFTVRVSSREAWVAPDRGKQGNALMTIIAMPFVLNGEVGTVEIATGGTAYAIVMRLDRIRQQPLVKIDAKPSKVKIGTSVRVGWPDSASQLLDQAKSRFLLIAENYAWLNPHLTIQVDWFGQRMVDLAGHEPAWLKWKPRDPTSAHWYRSADLARLVGAYIDHDGRAGRPRTVREFIGEFRGLSGSAKQKAVASAAGLTGASLGDLALPDGQLDTQKMGKLLAAMQAHGKPVKPWMLGILGQEHFCRSVAQAGAEMDTFAYRKIEGDAEGIPWVLEAAFAAHQTAFEGSEGEPINRRLVCGINWSPALTIPFHYLGNYGLESLLADQRVGNYPVLIAIHLVCPRIEYLDRGKSSITLPAAEVGAAIGQAVTKVTAAWAKQRKAEERAASAASRRRDRLARPIRQMTQVEAAFAVMKDAYLRASANGTLPAHARQIMYQARGPMQELTGKTLDRGFDQYFCQALLPRYMANTPRVPRSGMSSSTLVDIWSSPTPARRSRWAPSQSATTWPRPKTRPRILPARK